MLYILALAHVAMVRRKKSFSLFYSYIFKSLSIVFININIINIEIDWILRFYRKYIGWFPLHDVGPHSWEICVGRLSIQEVFVSTFSLLLFFLEARSWLNSNNSLFCSLPYQRALFKIFSPTKKIKEITFRNQFKTWHLTTPVLLYAIVFNIPKFFEYKTMCPAEYLR